MTVRFERNDKQIKRRIEDGVAGNEQAAANHLVRAIKKKLKGPRSGREYLVPGGKSATYTASAPGEAPAVATGDLLRSYQAVKKPGSGAWLVGTPLKYARYLEMGTSEIRPRPHFRETASEETPTIVSILRRRVA